MPVRARSAKRHSASRVNNNRLCPKANDILKQVQMLRAQRGRKHSIRDLNDEAVVEYYAKELASAAA